MQLLHECRERRHPACMSAECANINSALSSLRSEITATSSRFANAHAGRMPALPAFVLLISGSFEDWVFCIFF
jgi:hypothetical protein